jgi:hypothetical protein
MNVAIHPPQQGRILTFAHYILLCGLLLTACTPSAPPPTPTLPPVTPSQVPSPLPTLTRPPTLTRFPTRTPLPEPTSPLSLIPTIPARAPNKDRPIQVDNQLTTLQSREVVYSLYLNSTLARLKSATVRWTFERDKQSAEKSAVIPAHEVGRTVKLETTLSIDNMPIAESTLSYTWTLEDEAGNKITTPAKLFKITEAIRSERRSDLPIIAAKQSFKSNFPREALFSVTVTPERPITNARFFVTQNNGVVIEDYEARITTKELGQPLTVTFQWSSLFAPQIPWQEFETWWVFTDDYGRIYRTESAKNEYTDKKHAWKKTVTKRGILFTYSQSTANVNTLSVALDKSVNDLEKLYGYKLLYTPRIVVYNTTDDFKDWAPSIGETGGFIGLASGKWGGAVVAVYDSIRFTGYSIIKHELAHLFQFQSLTEAIPQWFIEGTARYTEDFPEVDNEALVRRVLKQYPPPSLQSSIQSVSPDRKFYGWYYFVGMSFVKYLITTYGTESYAVLHTALAKGADLNKALIASTGKSLAELDKEWAAWITK